LIHQCKWVKASDILDKIVAQTDAKGKKKAGELNDVLFGRLYGVLAVILSGILKTSEEADLERVLAICIELGRRKQFMQESSAWVLGRFVEERPDCALAAYALVFPVKEVCALFLTTRNPPNRRGCL
jgi:hypothetical protein